MTPEDEELRRLFEQNQMQPMMDFTPPEAQQDPGVLSDFNNYRPEPQQAWHAPMVTPQQTQAKAPDQLDASELLKRIYNQPAVSPDAQKAANVRQLLAGLGNVRRHNYDLGGGVMSGGDTALDVKKYEQSQKWANEPLDRDKAEKERMRNMLLDLEKVENMKSQAASRESMNQQRQATIGKMNEDARLKTAYTNPQAAESIAEQERVNKLLTMKADTMRTAADIDPKTGKARYPTILKYADSLDEIAKGVPGMSYNQIQLQLKNNDE